MFLAWNLPNMCGRQEYHGKRLLVHLSGHALPKKSRGKSHYVYNQKTCGRCHGVIQTWKIAQRWGGELYLLQLSPLVEYLSLPHHCHLSKTVLRLRSLNHEKPMLCIWQANHFWLWELEFKVGSLFTIREIVAHVSVIVRITSWKITFVFLVMCRTVYACEACQPPPPTISQSVTVKRRRAASICSTRLGRRDDTLDTEDTSVEDNVGMTVTTSKYWKNMMNPFLYLPILLAYVENLATLLWNSWELRANHDAVWLQEESCQRWSCGGASSLQAHQYWRPPWCIWDSWAICSCWQRGHWRFTESCASRNNSSSDDCTVPWKSL